MVEEELASLRQGKEQLSGVIDQMRATNEELEQDLRQLPALVNKTFQLENNLLLRGKAAAGVWPKERFSDRLKAMERLEREGAAAPRVAGGDQARGVVTVEEDAEEAAFEKRVREGGRHQRVLVAGEGSGGEWRGVEGSRGKERAGRVQAGVCSSCRRFRKFDHSLALALLSRALVVCVCVRYGLRRHEIRAFLRQRASRMSSACLT